MQVKMGEREKKIIKLGIILFRKKLGKRGKIDVIHDELRSINYSPIKRVVSLINRTADKTNHAYQKNLIREYGELSLWLVINHPLFEGMFESICRKLTNIRIPVEKFTHKSKLTKTEIWMMNKVLVYIKNKLLEPGGLYHYVEKDIESTQNEACRYMIPIIEKELEKIENDDIRESITMLSNLFIWCMIRDTAYRDQFFWMLWQTGNKEIRDGIKQHPTKLVKPFNLWYCNLWMKGQTESKLKRAKGELKMGEYCNLESPCVPNIQNKEVKRGFKR